jgi:hypothetical protein
VPLLDALNPPGLMGALAQSTPNEQPKITNTDSAGLPLTHEEQYQASYPKTAQYQKEVSDILNHVIQLPTPEDRAQFLLDNPHPFLVSHKYPPEAINAYGPLYLARDTLTKYLGYLRSPGDLTMEGDRRDTEEAMRLLTSPNESDQPFRVGQPKK